PGALSATSRRRSSSRIRTSRLPRQFGAARPLLPARAGFLWQVRSIAVERYGIASAPAPVPRTGRLPGTRAAGREAVGGTAPAAQARVAAAMPSSPLTPTTRAPARSAVLVVQIELSVRHGRSFTTRLRLGIGRHCRPPPARGGADPASRTHSAGQQLGTRTEP